MAEYPQLLHTALDTTAPRELAEFYRQLLGLRYRSGDEPPADGAPDEADWLVLVDTDGVRKHASAGRSAASNNVAPHRPRRRPGDGGHRRTIVELGSRDELVARDGEYAALWRTWTSCGHEGGAHIDNPVVERVPGDLQVVGSQEVCAALELGSAVTGGRVRVRTERDSSVTSEMTIKATPLTTSTASNPNVSPSGPTTSWPIGIATKDPSAS